MPVTRQSLIRCELIAHEVNTNSMEMSEFLPSLWPSLQISVGLGAGLVTIYLAPREVQGQHSSVPHSQLSGSGAGQMVHSRRQEAWQVQCHRQHLCLGLLHMEVRHAEGSTWKISAIKRPLAGPISTILCNDVAPRDRQKESRVLRWSQSKSVMMMQ